MSPFKNKKIPKCYHFNYQTLIFLISSINHLMDYFDVVITLNIDLSLENGDTLENKAKHCFKVEFDSKLTRDKALQNILKI